MGLTMRQSTLSTADTCMKRLEFELAGRPRKSSEASALGTGYHFAMEMYYSERKEKGFFIPTPEQVNTYAGEAAVTMFLELPRSKWKYEDPDKKLEALKAMVHAYFEGQNYWPEGWQVRGVEVSWQWDWLPNMPASGTIDLVLLDPNGWTILDDHKTAGRAWPGDKHKPRKNRQAPWYTYWWEVMTGERPSFVFDVMTHACQFERRPAEVTEAHQKACLHHAELVAKRIMEGGEMMANPSSNLCSEKFCAFWEECPYGAILN